MICFIRYPVRFIPFRPTYSSPTASTPRMTPFYRAYRYRRGCVDKFIKWRVRLIFFVCNVGTIPYLCIVGRRVVALAP